MSDLELGVLIEKVLNDFGEEILRYNPAPEEREEHLATLGVMIRDAMEKMAVSLAEGEGCG